MKFSVIHIILAFLLFLIAINPLFAQKIDSSAHLKESLKHKADSIYEVGVRNDKATNYKQSLVEFKKALKLYKEINDAESIGDSYTYIAVMNTILGRYSQAIDNYEKAKTSYEKAGNQRATALVLVNMGGVYYSLSDYPKSLKYYKKALTIQHLLNKQHDIAYTTLHIGLIYAKVDDYDKALNHYKKANKIFKRFRDSLGISSSLSNIGLIHLAKEDFKQAEFYFMNALNITEVQKNHIGKMKVLYSLGELFFKKSNYKNALSYYQNTLIHAKELNNLYHQALSQIALGKSYHYLGQDQKAISICSQGLAKAKELNSNSLKKEAYTCLYQAYKSIGNSKQALAFYEQAAIFEDSLNIEETSQHLMSMEMQNQALSDSLTYVKKRHILQLQHSEEIQQKNTQRNIIMATLAFILIIAGGLWSRLRFVRKSSSALQKEKDRSEKLLLNILPEEVAEELKAQGKSEAQFHEKVSVLFTDFVNFTQTSQKLGVKKLLNELNIYFTAFDEIMEKHDLEKIKTIGDAYLAVCGLPSPNEKHAINTVAAAFDILAFIEKRKKESPYALEIRIGINSGPIIAGIIGVKKFAYDIWGDTVNTAARMEQNSIPGKINISENTYQLVKNKYDCIARGKIEAKGKGEINMYFTNPIKPEQKVSNQEKMNYQALEKLMLDKLERELPKHLTYHTIGHVMDVRDSATAIALQENISAEDTILLKTAAIFHDAGFIFKDQDHEKKSCEMAKQYLPDYGYDSAQIEAICGMIMATKIPQKPQNHLEEILADADLDYLGRDDFFTIGEGLYQEFIQSGVVSTTEEWDHLQVKFFEQHHYFTQTSIRERKPKKMEHLQILKSKLNK